MKVGRATVLGDSASDDPIAVHRGDRDRLAGGPNPPSLARVGTAHSTRLTTHSPSAICCSIVRRRSGWLCRTPRMCSCAPPHRSGPGVVVTFDVVSAMSLATSSRVPPFTTSPSYLFTSALLSSFVRWVASRRDQPSAGEYRAPRRAPCSGTPVRRAPLFPSCAGRRSARQDVLRQSPGPRPCRPRCFRSLPPASSPAPR